MTWLTADLHFNHRAILEYCNRPWSTVEDMNEGLIERWNAKVGKRDRIYILGDFCFGGVGRSKEIVERLNGYKIIVRGNHDPKAHILLNAGFDQVLENERILIGDTWCYMSHFPYHPEGEEGVDDRYLHKRIKDDGSWLLHGHVHTAWKVRDKCINVGVDVNNWEPVHVNQINRIIEQV